MRVVGTAGHVDHGKSALILALTGRDPDRLAEEKRRGLTIDLGFGWTTLPSGREVGFVDVPGHERFVKNMLAGAGSVDASLLVVAANEGWMPQTQEHADILGLLGITGVLLVLTKVDLVDDETSELAALEAADALAGTALAGVPVVRTAPPHGIGLEDVRVGLDALLDASPAPADTGRPRLWVDRSFTIAGAGTVVTGTLTGGTLRTGTEVEVFASGAREGDTQRARVRAMQTHERSREEVEPGSRLALNLVGLERSDVRRGDMVGLAGQWRRTRHAHVALHVLPQAEPVGRRGAYKLYVGSAEHDVALRPIGTDAVEPGTEGLVDVHLGAAVPLVAGDRFIVREVGRRRTVAGGRVLDAAPGPGAARHRMGALSARREAFDRGPAALVDAVLAHGGVLGARDASQLLGVEALPDGPRLGGERVAAATVDMLRARAGELLGGYHGTHPARVGMPREELRERLGLRRAAFDELVGDTEFRAEEGMVRLASHTAHLGLAGDSRWIELEANLRAAGRMPPSRAEVLAGARLDRDALATLLRQGRLVDVDGLLYLPEVLEDVGAAVRSFLEVREQATASELRAILGITRKWAIPLLEHLDRSGLTTRDGDVRRLRP